MGRIYLGLLGLVALVGVLTFLAQDADALASPTIGGPSVIGQGEAVTIQVVPDADGPVPGDELMVVTPYGNCQYVAAYAAPGPNGAYQFTYPGTAFSATPATSANENCYEAPNTFISGSFTSSQYTVRTLAGNAQIRTTFMVSFFEDLRPVYEYNRTDELTIVTRGHDPGIPVTFQIDRPFGTGFQVYDTFGLLTDDDGVVRVAYRLPAGIRGTGEDPTNDEDLGTWRVHVIDCATRGKVCEDVVPFEVGPTRIDVDWAVQPTPAVPRTAFTGGHMRATYHTSIPGGTPLNVTGDSFRDNSNRMTMDLYIQGPDGTDQRVGPVDASFVQSPGLATTNLWRADYQPAKDATVGIYRFALVGGADDFGNTIPSPAEDPRLISSYFQVTASPISATFDIQRTQVVRADRNASVDADISLRYVGTQPVSPSDLPGPVRIGIFQNGQRVLPNFAFTPVEFGGRWELNGTGAELPPGTPLGEIRLGLVAPTGDAWNNPLTAATLSDPMTVSITQPHVTMAFLNGTATTSTFLRGETVQAVVAINYPDGSALTDDQVSDAGFALFQFLPPDGQTINVDLRYNAEPQDFPNRWIATYKTRADDAVGVWDARVFIEDEHGNRNTKVQQMRVGLVVQATLSDTEVGRTETVTVTATMTRPGTATPEPGSLNVTIIGAGVVFVDRAPMVPTAQGTYVYDNEVPFDAPLGTYTVEVRGSGSSDSGREVVHFEVVSAAVGVANAVLSQDDVPRLDDVSLSFQLKYPDEGPLTQAEATPSVSVVGPGGSSSAVNAAYGESTGKWTAVFPTALDTPLGSYHFTVSGQDVFGNPIEAHATRSFEVLPAQIRVTNLEPLSLAYDRGERVVIHAQGHYADGTTALDLTIPVEVLAGADKLATIDLTYNSDSGFYEGTYQIQLRDPLSTAAAPWTLRVASKSVTDADGNQGPPVDVRDASGFAVRTALLSVELVEQPASGLSIGLDEASIRFRFVSADGTPVNVGLSGINVTLMRGSVPVGPASVRAVGDGFEATFPLTATGLAEADNYRFAIAGADEYGNQVRASDTQPFAVTGSGAQGGGLPGPGLVLALVGAAVALAVAARVRGRQRE